MFTRSHLQELKRRYASMYAPPVEEEVIEDGTIEGANQYRKDTPGQEEIEVDEGVSLQVSMALDDVGLKGTWKNGKVYVKKRDVKKAEKALKGNVIYKGKPPVVVGEEIQEHCGVCGEGEGIEEGKPARKLAQRDVGMECMECGKKFRAKLSTLQYGRTKCPKCKSTDLDFAYGESVEEEVKEGWKKGKYTIKDDKGNILGTYPNGAKAAKAQEKMFQQGDYDKLVMAVVEEQQIDEKGTAYPATVDTLRKIVKDKQHQTVMFKSGKAIVDLFTASAMVQVYDALKKPDMKKTFEKMITDKAGFMKTQAFAMKMVGK